MVHRCIALVAFVMLATPPGHARHARLPAADPDIRGAWHAELYELATGERHSVKGLIIFTASDWSVTFFFTPDGQAPQRAWPKAAPTRSTARRSP